MKKTIFIILVFAMGLLLMGCTNKQSFDMDLLEKVHEISDNQELMFSSNPYDYITAKQDVFDSIISAGDAAVKEFVNEIRNAKEHGLDQYIMAAACAQITGIGKSGGWASAKEWLDLYDGKSELPNKAAQYVGKYITDAANVFSSFMPELEFFEDGTFVLNTGINRFVKGRYEVWEDRIVPTILENTTEFEDSYVANLIFTIKSYNIIVLDTALPEVTKASAVFRRVYASAANEQAANSTLSIRGSKDGVKAFVALQNQVMAEDGTEGNVFSYELCYNITPKEVIEKSNCQIFKYSDSCESYLLYEGQIVSMGISFGGLGLVDVKVCDFDKDGNHELLYTYSFGSGLHRSHVAHFDLKTKRQTELDYTYLNDDMMIVINADEQVSLYHANVEAGKIGLIDFDLTAGKYLADVVYENGKLSVLEKQ